MNTPVSENLEQGPYEKKLSYLTGLGLMFLREWRIANTSKTDWLNALIFFIMALCVFPLTLPPDLPLLKVVTPGLVWIMALLSMMLASDLWFKEDFEQGFLHQCILSPYPLTLLVIAKIIAHWVLLGGSLVLAIPFLSVVFNLTFELTALLMVTLALGTLAMSFICALSAALTVGLRQAGVLLVIISLPLNIPIMIFGAGITNEYLSDMSIRGSFLMLAAITCSMVTIMPFAIAAALSVSTE